MKSKRTIATSITKEVYQTVLERDKQCIFCGSTNNLQCMHFIPRSKGGLGIKENLAMGCWTCHMKLDQSIHRKEMLKVFENVLNKYYDYEIERVYKK